jgi:hypothetical protein
MTLDTKTSLYNEDRRLHGPMVLELFRGICLLIIRGKVRAQETYR